MATATTATTATTKTTTTTTTNRLASLEVLESYQHQHEDTSNNDNCENNYTLVHQDGIIKNDNDNDNNDQGNIHAQHTLWNFILMSFLFSANQGCAISCLELATARLGSTGAWQSGILYLSYFSSALFGATYIVKRFGPRNGLLIGMSLYCMYISCFYFATLVSRTIVVPDDDHYGHYDDSNDNDNEQESIDNRRRRAIAWTGAAIGGIGAGIVWTAQGTYFTKAAEVYSQQLQQPISTSTSSLGGIFACFFLLEEFILRILSSIVLHFEVAPWETIFAIYAMTSIGATMSMSCVHNYPSDDDGRNVSSSSSSSSSTSSTSSMFYKVTAAIQLLLYDRKMKYMIGLNAVFGFTSAFINSYINGQVVPMALNDPTAKYVGILSSLITAVAAIASLCFGRISPIIGKGPILIFGSCCFCFGVVFPFVVEPNVYKYTWTSLVVIYIFHGLGRATFEGTLKATFADYFTYEKEGAFANIILQDGLAGAIGYVLTFALHCHIPSRYCIKYTHNDDGMLRNVLSYEVIVLLFTIYAIFGYIKASTIHHHEQEEEEKKRAQEMEQSKEYVKF